MAPRRTAHTFTLRLTQENLRWDRGTPGALIVEVRLPEMDGLQLQGYLNRIGCILPMIFLSRDIDIPTAVEAMRAGAFHVIEKPILQPHLIDRVGAALVPDLSAPDNTDAE